MHHEQRVSHLREIALIAMNEFGGVSGEEGLCVFSITSRVFQANGRCE